MSGDGDGGAIDVTAAPPGSPAVLVVGHGSRDDAAMSLGAAGLALGALVARMGL